MITVSNTIYGKYNVYLVQNPQDTFNFQGEGGGGGGAAPVPRTSSVNEPSPSLTQKFWLTENNV